MKILQTILLTRSRDYLHSNSLCGKQNSVEQQLVNIGVRSRQNNDRRKSCRASKITNLKNLRLTDRIAIMKQSTGRKQWKHFVWNRTVLNQQCAEDNTTIKKTAEHAPTTGSVWQLQSYLHSFCDLDGNNKIFSLDCLNQLSTVKRIFWWEFCSSVFFSDVGRKFLHVRAGAVACNTYQCSSLDKKNWSWRRTIPQKEGFLLFTGDVLITFFVPRINETCTPVRDLLARTMVMLLNCKLWIFCRRSR